MTLRSQTTCERADRLVEKADDTNGNTEDIGGEVCARGGATLTVSVKGEACAMAGKTKATRIDQDSITAKISHDNPVDSLTILSYRTYMQRNEGHHVQDTRAWDTGIIS